MRTLPTLSLKKSCAALALLCLPLLGGCGRKDARAQGAPQAMPVDTLVIQEKDVPDSSEFLATLRSRNTSTIRPQVEGYITEIRAKSGEHVKRGELLMKIDAERQEAAVTSQAGNRAAVKAKLDLAKQEFQRVTLLFQQGVASKQQYDQAKSAVESAQSELDALEGSVREQQVQLRYYNVTAPSEGIVGDIPVRVGDRVDTKTEVTTVTRPGPLEAYITVPVDRSKQLKPGLPVQLVDDTGKVIAQTRIDFVSPEVDDKTQTVLAKAQITNANAGLRTEQITRARVIWSVRKRPTVPVLSLARINGKYFAYVAEFDGKGYVVRQRMLEVGEIVGNEYEVTGGLKPGDQLIVGNTSFLRDGMPVVPKAAQAAGTKAS